MYVETAADHAFTAFLAHLKPSQVLRDRERTFSKEERKRQLFLRQKSALERQQQHDQEVLIALDMAAAMRQKADTP